MPFDGGQNYESNDVKNVELPQFKLYRTVPTLTIICTFRHMKVILLLPINQSFVFNYCDQFFYALKLLVAAVQQERKPPEMKEARSCSTVVSQSGQRIYLHKDLESPSSSVSTFAEKSEV